MIHRRFVPFIVTVLFCGAWTAADEPALIRDETLRSRVESRFAQQRRLARHREQALFGVLEQKLLPDEREALEFLFAFMPLSDLADYDGEYYLRVVRATLEARRTLPWGERIPEDIFLHYVLPHRVNNENLDESRPVFFAQLRDRVKELSLADAVLEVNHWAHEHVTYLPSDIRTSAPLATLRTSWGRCGEESTFVVAALRAVGIPARQVYTPRWAHVDDNHAWVEAWVDGAWRYLGACEPEPALDMGWFREPARRAMMVHTKVMGGSDGPEEKVRTTPWFDEINVLSRYAPTRTRAVRVLDRAGKPVEGASVDFGLYNYAEFYPLATKLTDAEGISTLVTGQGDLRIWAVQGDRVGSRKLSSEQREAEVVLNPLNRGERVEVLDLSPPREPMPDPVLQERAAREAHQQCLAKEDRLREAYMATFMDEAGSGKLSGELGLDADTLWPLMRKSQGNWREIAGFLTGVPAKRRSHAVELLSTLSDKDLRDTPAGVLRDHLDHTPAGRAPSDRELSDRELFVSAVLAPRIADELLRPWRGYLQEAFGNAFLSKVREHPERAATWVRRKIRIDSRANYYRVPLSPRGVHELRVADEPSRDLFFVALCRAAGVPARLEPATSRPQFHEDGAWRTVTWGGTPPAVTPTGKLSLSTETETTPEYFIHFTLARFEQGRYETLDFEGRPWESFRQPFDLQAGHYVLTTGRRQIDGSVLARQQFFDLQAGQTHNLPLVLRTPREVPPVLGRLELGDGPTTLDDGRPLDLAKMAGGKGIVLAWIGPGEEPSNHALRDLARLRVPFEKWGGGLVLVFDRPPEEGMLRSLEDRDLAQQAIVAVDDRATWLGMALQTLGRSVAGRLPVILGVNAEGEVIFFSEGYSIGVGERVLQVIRRLEQR